MLDKAIMRLKFPAYFKPYNEKFYRLKGLKGGRGSAKTTCMAQRFILLALQERAKFLCCREIQKSIKDSNYASIRKAAEKIGMASAFSFLFDRVKCKITGSDFLFHGLHTNVEKILSLEGVKYVWIEQAESVSEESIKLLTPTIREDDSEIAATWNPRYPTDYIEKYFNANKSIALLDHVNYSDNPFFPKSLEIDRNSCEENLPEDYPNVWLGGYRQANVARTLISYNDIRACVGAAKKLNYVPRERFCYMGLDVADGGADRPAFVIRHGSNVLRASETNDKDAYEIASTIIPIAYDYPLARCHYDVTGVGAGIKTEFIRAAKNKKLPFFAEPFLFGGKVQGKDRVYAHKVTNAEFFSRANAQGYWNLRLRVANTKRALAGAKVNLDRCLFLPERIPEKLLQEINQIEYERDRRDKIIVIKAPEGCPSPNIADALMMSYALDIKKGLVAY
ncbi:MAG: PBSX family phage terminase large subunit [Gammaproteobacteria bacterium]